MARKKKQQPTANEPPKPEYTQDAPPSPRRNFIVEVFAFGLGAVVGLVPLAVGIVTYLNPLRSKDKGGAGEGDFVRITTLDSVPPDGRPYRFPVIKQREDAWSVYPDSRVGSIYLRRTSADELPTAYSATCPHLGCSIDFKPEEDLLLCPCHNSKFLVDGARMSPATSPSPRDMDELQVEVRNENEVWVDYQKFRGGIEAKEVV